MVSLQVEQGKVAQLSRELQCREEWLGEERREREELEADLERQKDCNRVSESVNGPCSVDILLGVSTGKVNTWTVINRSCCTPLRPPGTLTGALTGSYFRSWRNPSENTCASGIH